jgi:acyl CoA:acetate/3-ketoacid CoA transferase beta subunit
MNIPNQPEFSIDEQIVVCIARCVEDGELLAQGLATPLVAAGYILAKCTHAPHVSFASAIGQALCFDWAPLGIARIEDMWLGKALVHIGFVSVVADVLPRLRPKEFFRPGQVDAQGNFNNIAFGKDYQHPRLRLPGTGGIPDVTTFSSEIYLYVPRHSRVSFVENLDYLSGLGHHPARIRGMGARYLVSDLGQFNWANGRMRLVTYHRGVSIEQIQRKTGFMLEIAENVHETPPPTAEELHWLREQIDPLGVRRLELLSGPARREALRQILQAEGAF